MAAVASPPQHFEHGQPRVQDFLSPSPGMAMPPGHQVSLKQVEVSLPMGCAPGQNVVCTTSEGETLSAIAQERLQPGATVTLQYPCSSQPTISHEHWQPGGFVALQHPRSSPEVQAHCPRNHPLRPFVNQTTGRNLCNYCSKEVKPPEVIFRCASCDFDCCQRCYPKASLSPPVIGQTAATPSLQATGREVCRQQESQVRQQSQGRRQQSQPRHALTEEQLRRRRKKADEKSARAGRCLYFAGWLLLPVFGIGLFCWLVAAWQYSCKSRKAQRRFPRQRETASLSACTLIFVILLFFALLIVGFGIFVLFDESFAASPFEGPQLEGPPTVSAQTHSHTTKAMLEALQAAARHAKAWRQKHQWHWGVVQMTQYPSTVSQPVPKGFLARSYAPVRVVTFTA